MKHKCTIFWQKKCRAEDIEKMRQKFGIPHYTTLNGESPAEIDDADMELLRECERRGFISIRDRKWEKKGIHYIFISR